MQEEWSNIGVVAERTWHSPHTSRVETERADGLFLEVVVRVKVVSVGFSEGMDKI